MATQFVKKTDGILKSGQKFILEETEWQFAPEMWDIIKSYMLHPQDWYDYINVKSNYDFATVFESEVRKLIGMGYYFPNLVKYCEKNGDSKILGHIWYNDLIMVSKSKAPKAKEELKKFIIESEKLASYWSNRCRKELMETRNYKKSNHAIEVSADKYKYAIETINEIKKNLKM